MQRYAILLVDAVAERRKKCCFCRCVRRSNVSKGELLVAVANTGHAEDANLRDCHLAKDDTATVHANSEVAASLTEHEFALLEAIVLRRIRYGVYQSGRCSWGAGLKVNDDVNVALSRPDAQASAIIRYIGEIHDYNGTMFGVEIVDKEHLHRGRLNGTWKGETLFECAYNRGLFVSLDRISKVGAQIELSNTSQENGESLRPPTLQQPSKLTDVSLATQQSVPESITSTCTSQRETTCGARDGRQECLDFEIGSLVQVNDPPLYGVIRVMCAVPKIQGIAAGIELEEYRKGCSDGTWRKTRYFSCLPGRALFCPVASLKLDKRFAKPELDSSLLNPLRDWPLEEPEDQPISDDQLVKYLGEERGIQGHYNSCYLDATVFGLFALSDAFDPMLQTKARDPAGEEIRGMLWKGIVNPLRKNGVVRHESVMTLRNKLEELGKIKRVNRDEKDPEEFLNMLFKHALNVDAFISIKRPFGIEDEFFVQLFLEPDESLKLPPTVGQLLNKMFKEQNISFTTVPNKLLIQIPRYGKQFKTYEKVIPGLQLDVVDLIDHPNCFICKNPAQKKCLGCATDHLKSEQPVYFCNTCCSQVHGGSETSAPEQIIRRCDKEATDVFPVLNLLSVICIETSHYVCFTRSVAHGQNKWIFFDSMADRVYDQYNIPKGVDCTEELNNWVYSGVQRLQSTPYSKLPELVRRFTHDIYLCVYIY